MKNPSLVGAKYMLTFIDDFYMYTWVYFLKNKSRVFEKFKELRELVETNAGELWNVRDQTMVEGTEQNLWILPILEWYLLVVIGTLDTSVEWSGKKK